MKLLKKLYKTIIPESSGFQFFLWKYRHLIDRNYRVNSINAEDIKHPHRLKTLEILKEKPFDTLLEIGCGKGHNLFLFAKELPQAKFTGIDINPQSIKIAAEYSLRNGLKNVDFKTLSIKRLEEVPAKSFSVVLVDAVLIYVDDRLINEIARQLARIAEKRIILVEFNDEKADAQGYTENKCWIRNYAKLFESYAREIRITAVEKGSWTENWEKYGCFIEIELK